MVLGFIATCALLGELLVIYLLYEYAVTPRPLLGWAAVVFMVVSVGLSVTQTFRLMSTIKEEAAG